jgi:hypothetical protein
LKPVSSTLFDVEFTSSKISEEEKDVLKKCAEMVGVNKNGYKIVFSVLYDEAEKKIIPIDIILKLKTIASKFDVIITILDAERKSIGTLVYKECNMEADFSDFLYFSNFCPNSFGIDFGINKKITVNIFPETVLYNNQTI